MVTSEQCLKKYGSPVDEVMTVVNENTKFEQKWMLLFELPEYIRNPIPCLPRKIYCNKDLKDHLIAAFTNVISRNLTHEIKTWDGCFNIRLKRGLKTMSLHSWGIAIDINSSWNQLGKVPTMSAALVSCFEDAGFDWGGRWVRVDGMHFQLSKI